MEKIDIDCILTSLTNSQVLETTKQHIIMNIDNPLNESELNTKLKKLNKLTMTLIPGSTQQNKTLVTKGLVDTYRLVIESVIIKSKVTPVILAFHQCTLSLLQLLRDYENKGIIKLKLGYAGLKSLISLVNSCEIIDLVCFPMVDQISGQVFLTKEVNQFVISNKKVNNWYLDLSAGLPIIYDILSNYKQRESMPFDFWSIDCNQINGSHKTGLLMFKGNKMSQLATSTVITAFSSIGQNYLQPVMADSLLGIYNSLQVFLCNRTAKTLRLFKLQKELKSLLKSQDLLISLNIDDPYNMKSIESQLASMKHPLVVLNIKGANQSPNVILLSLIHKKQKLSAVPIQIISKVFNSHQILLDHIPIERLYFVEGTQNKELFRTTIQLSMNDLTFRYVIDQFYRALLQINKCLSK